MNLKVEVVAPVIIASFLLVIITVALLLYYKIKRRRNKQHTVSSSDSPFKDSKWKKYVQLDSQEKMSHGSQKEKKRNGQYVSLLDSNYLDVYDSLDELDDSDYHSESEACDRAKKKNGNFLRTSKGKVTIKHTNKMIIISIRCIQALLTVSMLLLNSSRINHYHPTTLSSGLRSLLVPHAPLDSLISTSFPQSLYSTLELYHALIIPMMTKD